MRRLLRITGVLSCGFLLIALIGAFVLHTYGRHRLQTAREGFESTWGHLASVDAPPEVPENENGARWLTAGGYAIVWSLDDQKFIGGLSGRAVRTWTDTESSRARWILNEQQSALRILVRSGSFDAFHLGSIGRHTTHDQIPFIDIIKGLRLLIVEARLAWFEDRRDDSLKAIAAVARAADGLLRTRIIMSSIIGAAATRWAAGGAAELISDPCADRDVLSELGTILPVEDPSYWADVTLATQVQEIADEGLDYIEDFHDPAMGWSIPFWVSSHYLFEDLFVAEILDRWSQHLEIGLQPTAHWPEDASEQIWGDASWPPWQALAGTITPNILSGRARAQAASAEMQQLRIALELRLAGSAGLGPEACDMVGDSSPSALTGDPVDCRYDPDLNAIVIEVREAEEVLAGHVSGGSGSSRFPPIVLPVGRTADLCR
jgi:hypothetical protein